MSTMEGRPKRQEKTFPILVLMPFALVLILTASAPPAGAQQDGEGMTNPVLGDEAAIKEGEKIFRGRCTGCHWSPLRAPVLFQTEMSDEAFLETVISGRQGNRGNMPPFGYVLSPDDVWKVHAFVMSTDGL
jgi:mono/diheme cytochrome c family protein